MIDLQHVIHRVRHSNPTRVEGRVEKVVGLLVEVAGLAPPIGTELEVRVRDRALLLEVVGFRDGRALAAPLGPIAGIEPGAWVSTRAEAGEVEVSEALLGRVLDAFGRPLDGMPAPKCLHRVPLHAPPPPPFARRPIETALETGVRALDALLPLGKGQRIGLFAGTGVGKSTLLGMLCRHTKADVIVVGLVGERGREVLDFVRGALGEEGLARSVVVAATSDAAPLVRVRGALRATAIAEYFRDRGHSVLLVMDSVTRFAMALREATLAAGEPPLSKGYTPSVFAALPSLLERTGNGVGEGSITAVYTVLVEGDDLQDPIADAVRGILDGHVVLSRKLADRGLFPAIDVLRSVSRVATEICTSQHLRATSNVRDRLSAYTEAADLISIGAYAPGSDPRVDAARVAVPRIEEFIRQGLTEVTARQDSIAQATALGELR
ncbi:MAG: FliI/YscN family ATPase [Myxococcales bacterium]|nr:FliI/YscN family ATPase [Myxococcales bacterium]